MRTCQYPACGKPATRWHFCASAHDEDGSRCAEHGVCTCAVDLGPNGELPEKARLIGDPYPTSTAMSPFAPGRRWFVNSAIRARFWFVIVGPGMNGVDKPSATHKRCRIEIHPDDLAAHLAGYQLHGHESTYSHGHLKKYAVLEPV